MGKTSSTLYDVLAKYQDAVDKNLDLAGKLNYVGAKSINELFPIYHYYVENKWFHSEKLLVAHINKGQNGADYELCDPDSSYRDYPYGLRYDELTGELIKTVRISSYEGRLYRNGSYKSVWLREEDESRAKGYLRAYYKKQYNRAVAQLATAAEIMNQLT